MLQGFCVYVIATSDIFVGFLTVEADASLTFCLVLELLSFYWIALSSLNMCLVLLYLVLSFVVVGISRSVSF